MPASTSFYSLAIDDRAAPRQAVSVMTDDIPPTEDIDTHSSIIHCTAVYLFDRQTDPGTWTVATPPGWNDDIYNAQAMLIPQGTSTEGAYLLYLLGMDWSNSANPQFYCRWASWSLGTPPVWHTPTNTNDVLPVGSQAFPIYPSDLVVENGPTAGSFYLYAATSQSIYRAIHNGTSDNIAWEECMGMGENAIRTRGFQDITVVPTSGLRYSHLAVAGEVCSYFTTDAGDTWFPIIGTGRMIDYPAVAAQQLPDHNMVTLHTGSRSDRRNNGPWTDFPYYPVFVELATPAINMTFQKTVQLGYTLKRPVSDASIPSPVVLAASDVHQAYLAAWVDSFTTYENGTDTRGICYRSVDYGETWSPVL